MTTQFYILKDRNLIGTNNLMDNRAFAYGDGFFSTLGVKNGKILWQNQHQARIHFSAKQFLLDIDITVVMANLQLLAKKITEGTLKIIITRENQNISGYGFYTNHPLIFIKSIASNIYQHLDFIGDFPIQKDGQACICNQSLGIRASRFGGIKLISSHEQVFARHEFLIKQQSNPKLSEALVKNIHNDIVSGTSSNVYYQLDNRWYTPFVRASGVHGVVRRRLLTNGKISKRIFSDGDLSNITALFFSNAVKGITPINKLWINANDAIFLDTLAVKNAL